MKIDFLQITSAFLVLFSIIDILGAIPIILSLKRKGEKIEALRVSIVALIILILFLFGGEFILTNIFKVNVESFAVAGSVVIFLFAIEMLLDVEIYKNKGPEGSASIVPIAFPLVAGPASFTTLLSLRAEYETINIIVALVLNLIFVYLVLKLTDVIQKLLGEGGIYIIRKFFGIILLAIAVKLFTTNIGGLM